MFDVVYYQNDTVISMTNVRNSVSGEMINNATVQINGIREYGTNTAISPLSFPITMSYQAGSAGSYQGVLSRTLNLQPNTKYTISIQARTLDQMQSYWEFSFMCRVRQE